jgi:hypothetical protein
MHHGLKAEAATQLHRDGHLDRDYGPLLRNLNQARKDIWYEGEEPELGNELNSIADDLDSIVKAAEATQ